MPPAYKHDGARDVSPGRVPRQAGLGYALSLGGCHSSCIRSAKGHSTGQQTAENKQAVEQPQYQEPKPFLVQVKDA